MNKKAKGAASIILNLRNTLDQLTAQSNRDSLSPRARRDIEGEIKQVIERLGRFLTELDPIRQPSSVFDPSNPKVIGRFVSLALVAQDRCPLNEIPAFYGSGIYAIYYKGPFKLYAPISKTETPIYVGQAAPAIRNARTPSEQGDKLCGRLADHRKNICKARTTLDIEDFEFRSLVVQSGWETAAEDYLIHLFHPIWNSETKILFGLGKHGDSADTRANKRSPWDTIHPGREWAANKKLSDAKPIKQIEDELKKHFKGHGTFKDLNSVLNGFIDELKQI